jgi:RNA polymerase sigma-70 factor (ECF subfamily)
LRKKRIQTFSIDDEKHAAHLSDMRSAFSADQTEAKSRKDALNKAIGLLSAEDATIITLFYQAEMNLAEVGKVLSADVNTVKVRLFRARQKLKLILEEKFADEMLQTHGT